jgi:hypothetical protein
MPRALARTKAGRTKVADWLKYLENGAAKAGAGDPMASYDFTWMWNELALGDLMSAGSFQDRATVIQQKTDRPVQFEIMAEARKSLKTWLDRRAARFANSYSQAGSTISAI